MRLLKARRLIGLTLILIAVLVGLAYQRTQSLRLKTTTEKGRNQPPEVRLLYPEGGEELSGIVKVYWSATDPDEDPLSITIQYTSDPIPYCPSCPQQKWHDIAIHLHNTGDFRWDTTKLNDGKYLLRIIASDGMHTSETISRWITLKNGN